MFDHHHLIAGSADLHDLTLEPITTDSLARMNALVDAIEGRLLALMVRQPATAQE